MFLLYYPHFLISRLKYGTQYCHNSPTRDEEKLASETEYAIARETLECVGWAVDYIISHCCPTSVQDVISGGMYQHDTLTDFLEEVRQRCQFQYWFFGHYHNDQAIEGRFVLLYEQIIRL